MPARTKSPAKSPPTQAGLRRRIRALHLAGGTGQIARLAADARLSREDRQAVSAAAAATVRQLRQNAAPSLVERFLAEYRLSSKEGIALMCLAEALPRIPDSDTAQAFVLDKIVPSNWSRHLNRSSSVLVNASTWALMLSGKMLREDDEDEDNDLLATLHALARRLGESALQAAVARAVGAFGQQFVLAETIEAALRRAADMQERGCLYSYDMLGEAACSQAQADGYHLAYSNAISALAAEAASRPQAGIHERPGISVKLSALHPRYCLSQRRRVREELAARCLSLALLAKSAGIGFNLDAEESERLDLSLDVIEAVLSQPALAGWDGFGVAVQAYSQRAPAVIDWLYALARRLDRRIMVRLVKGAYWDREIKRAQTLGLDGFAVFTHKCDTDVAYIACARQLLDMRERIYPQFATHNAHSIHAVLHLAGDTQGYELQRLHGMGMALHEQVRAANGNRCRIYAPVGGHRRLLSYLARRLLENGANNSFVHRLGDDSIKAEDIAADPFAPALNAAKPAVHPAIRLPAGLFGERRNSRGWDWDDPLAVEALEQERAPFRKTQWRAGPMLAQGEAIAPAGRRQVFNPALPDEAVGEVAFAGAEHVAQAVATARQEWPDWRRRSAARRAALLNAAADLYEANAGELFALLAREAGKCLPDAVNELREAVDFLRYYAEQAQQLPAGLQPLGLFACISPWNFPLAIFTGQIAAALAAGNMALAKPSERAPLIAARATALLHEAGIPPAALQLLPDDGGETGALLAKTAGIDGVCFTGSTGTAQAIHRAMVRHLAPNAPLIAETGGINAMIVDSTALTEQAVEDILASAFQSAGQRCSALRMLYVQEDAEEEMLQALFGAMDELRLGDPALLETDIGPVIDARAQTDILACIEAAERQGRCVKRCAAPPRGHFVAPSVVRVSGIGEVEGEIFGPVLHVARFAPEDIESIIADINARGYGLTFGLHSRIDKQVQHFVDHIRAGNFYVNRNQIGAVVGSQPFGGEGLSGTGPKAGGPNYLRRFCRPAAPAASAAAAAPTAATLSRQRLQEALRTLAQMQWGEDVVPAAALEQVARAGGLPAPKFNPGPFDLPGPTGESNRLMLAPRGIVLCLGPSETDAMAQLLAALATGCKALVAVPAAGRLADCFGGVQAPALFLAGSVAAADLQHLHGFDAAACCGADETLRPFARALAARDGRIMQLVTDTSDLSRFVHERHLCIDTTAAGGNASLLAATGG